MGPTSLQGHSIPNAVSPQRFHCSSINHHFVFFSFFLSLTIFTLSIMDYIMVVPKPVMNEEVKMIKNTVCNIVHVYTVLTLV